MPTPLGHALAGIALAGRITPFPAEPGRALWTGLAVAASSLPDVDTLLGFALAGGDFRALHRGFTHGLPFLLALAAGGAWLLRGRYRAPRVVCLLAACFASHVGLDLLTGASPPGPAYAVRILEPFSDLRLRLPVSLIPGTRLGPGSPPWAPWNLGVMALEALVFGGIALWARAPRQGTPQE